MRLRGKVTIVTGAGSGIGEAVSLRFADEGARLVLNDINGPAVEAVAARCRERGADAVTAVADISLEDGSASIAARAVEAFGGVDVVINNAAEFTQKNVEAASVEDWRRVLGVNVVGTALVSKYAIPHLKQRGGGAIVNIASMSGVIAQPDFATYNASKGAVITMTKCMALDLAPFKIRVNSLCPGCILTNASYREIARMGITFEEWEARVAPLHMLARLGEPLEVANAALFLASDESSFITATTLMVDGGYTGR